MIGILDLFFVFLALKLFNVVEWSWCVVFLPLIIPCVIVFSVLVFVLIMNIVGFTIEKIVNFLDDLT